MSCPARGPVSSQTNGEIKQKQTEYILKNRGSSPPPFAPHSAQRDSENARRPLTLPLEKKKKRKRKKATISATEREQNPSIPQCTLFFSSRVNLSHPIVPQHAGERLFVLSPSLSPAPTPPLLHTAESPQEVEDARPEGGEDVKTSSEKSLNFSRFARYRVLRPTRPFSTRIAPPMGALAPSRWSSRLPIRR